VTEEMTQLAGEMGLIEDISQVEKDKVIGGKKGATEGRAEDKKWEIVSREETKTRIRHLTVEEWKTVKELREKNGKGSKKGWLFFNGTDGNIERLSREEWKVIEETREKNKNRGWFF